MKSILVFTICLIILLLITIFFLLHKNYIMSKKLKYVNDANMWHKLAFTDDLTGIGNRTSYNRHILKFDKHLDNCCAIMLFDIDNFKNINDTQGHLAGDIVLKNVAKNLSDVFYEPKYSVFRIGGDEFAVVAENVYEEEIIQRMLFLKDSLEANGEIRLSKGYAMVKGSVNKAFDYADEMLYADKASKK